MRMGAGRGGDRDRGGEGAESAAAGPWVGAGTSAPSVWASTTTWCAALTFAMCAVTLALMLWYGESADVVARDAAPTHVAEVVYVERWGAGGDGQGGQAEAEPLGPVGEVWIFGLESSGTRWLANAVYRARHAGDAKARKWDGEHPPCMGKVNHVSLPWGQTCEAMRRSDGEWPLPPVRVMQPDMCAAQGKGRMQVDISGVLAADPTARAVFIVRPREAQEAGVVSNGHCNHETALRAEGHQGEQLMIDAQRAFPERTVMTYYEDYCWRRREVWEQLQAFLGLDAIDPDTFGESFDLPGMTENRPCELPD